MAAAARYDPAVVDAFLTALGKNKRSGKRNRKSSSQLDPFLVACHWVASSRLFCSSGVQPQAGCAQVIFELL